MKTLSQKKHLQPLVGDALRFAFLTYLRRLIPTYVTLPHMKLRKNVRVLCIIAPLNRGINICWWLGF